MSDQNNSQYGGRNPSSPIYYKPPSPWSASPISFEGHHSYRYISTLICSRID